MTENRDQINLQRRRFWERHGSLAAGFQAQNVVLPQNLKQATNLNSCTRPAVKSSRLLCQCAVITSAYLMVFLWFS